MRVRTRKGGGRRIQTLLIGGVVESIPLPIGGVIESRPPPIGGVVESRPIPYHLLVAPLVIINERPLKLCRKTSQSVTNCFWKKYKEVDTKKLTLAHLTCFRCHKLNSSAMRVVTNGRLLPNVLSPPASRFIRPANINCMFYLEILFKSYACARKNYTNLLKIHKLYCSIIKSLMDSL